MHWILLRGLGREQAHWGGFPDRLRAAMPGDGVHTPDLPGTGRFCLQRSPTTIVEMLAAVKAQVEEVDAPMVLVGLSMGAMLALEWARQSPERFRSVVLINPSSRLNSVWHRLRPSCWPTVARALLKRQAGEREALILGMVSNQTQVIQTLDAWRQIAQQRPVSRSNLLRHLYAASKYRPPSQLGVGGLVLSSQQDRLVNPRCSEALARHLQWPQSRHPSAGHDLALDAPDWLVEQLLSLGQGNT